MYTLSKGNTSKILAKTRRTINQKLDPFDNTKDFKKDSRCLPLNDISAAKPIFHCNGKKSCQPKDVYESISPQHQEMIKYIQESWANVMREYESCRKSKDLSSFSITTDPVNKSLDNKEDDDDNLTIAKIAYFKDKSLSNQLPKFEPFDLETFWGQRLFQNITQSS